LKKTIVLLLFAVLVLSPFAFFTQPTEAQRDVPPNQPERGLVYDGLEVARDGSCKGAYHVKAVTQGRPVCTHGPDAVPATLSISAVAPVTTVPPPVTCDGDGTTGKRVQVLYVHPSTVADNYAAYLTSFQQWAADADSEYYLSAQQTGGIRHIRFVTDANCMPVVLDATVSAAAGNDFGTMINELAAQGYGRTDRKYMLFVDATSYCGISSLAYDDQRGPSNVNNSGQEYARIDARCWSGVIAAHELMHTLGGVQLTAPHSDANGHCNDGYDNMCDHSGHAITYPCPNPAGDALFDCNHDDYYNANPASGSYLFRHWNTADNQFLINPAVAATVPLVDSLLTGVLGKGGTFTPAATFSAGSTVTARAHVVDQNGAKLPGAAVTLSFKRPDGSIQCTATGTTDSSGTALASCATPASAPKGTWSVHPVSVMISTMVDTRFNSVGDCQFTIQ